MDQVLRLQVLPLRAVRHGGHEVICPIAHLHEPQLLPKVFQELRLLELQLALPVEELPVLGLPLY